MQITVSEHLPAVPFELAPNFDGQIGPVDLTNTVRRPNVGEWVNFYQPEANGGGTWRRGVVGPFLGRVVEVLDKGCNVQFWNKAEQAFTSEGGLPWCCIVSRAAVSAYSLSREA